MSGIWLNQLPEKEYRAIKQQFPNLEDLRIAERSPGGYNYPEYIGYWRSDMLQALWNVAGEESEKVKDLIDQLD